MQHNHLSTQFSSTIEGVDKWGFVVVRTVYGEDEAAWSTALSKLQEYALPTAKNARKQPDTFVLPVIADPTLDGASYDAVRTAFNAWVTNYQEEHGWGSDVRRDCCLVVDSQALASLLEAPDWPWVVVVDAEEPATIPYNGGGPYLGWTRVAAPLLGDLFADIDSMSLVQLCPRRVYDGQLPLYNGFPGGKLIDPEGGVDGRYKFPQGTPRGIEKAKAMLADIEEALGSEAVTQKADVGGRVRQGRSAA